MTILRDLTNTHLSKIIKAKKQTALIPIGSIEQHGPHLPVSTDSDIVTAIAKRISQKTGFFLLPTIEYGVSFEHHPLFNLSITRATLCKIVVELCISLWKNKINTIIILNGHHGNKLAFKKIVQKLDRISNGSVRVLVFSYWHFMKREFDHAGFVETSLMLAISKKVNMKKARKGLVIERFTKKKIERLNKAASKSFLSVTKSGIWGDPTKANAKDGRKILKEIVQNLLKESNLTH